MPKVTQTHHHDDPDMEFRSYWAKREKNLGWFSPIGPLRTAESIQRFPMEEDIFDILLTCPKGAQKLFLKLKFDMEQETNLVPYSLSDLSPSERTAFFKAVRELEQRQVCRKIKGRAREEFPMRVPRGPVLMINPNLIKPRPNALRYIEFWDNQGPTTTTTQTTAP